MRPVIRRGFLSAFAVFGLASDGFAQTASQQLGTVTVAEVTLRAAPKADAPDAGQLFRGLDVIVHHAEGDDWLAIQPPPGTISWINHKFVAVSKDKGFPQNAVVNSDGEVKIAVGKAGVNKPLDTRKTAVPDGTIVRVLAAGVKSDEDQSMWYPIQPLKDDFRYIPKAMVQLGSPAAENVVVKSPKGVMPAAASSENLTAAIPAKASAYPNKPAGWPNTNATWSEAETAEQGKDYDKAVKLYFQLAREMNGSGGDTDLANLCYTRIHAIRERNREAQGLKDNNWTAPKGDSPKVEPKKDDPWMKREEAGAAKPTWTGAGTLRLASVRAKDKQYYALEDSRGNLLYYAVTGANGIDLEKYLKKKVDLFGTVSYPAELRYGVVTVTRVDAAK
ncbi:hypothetical protein [Limnoglobus roseus]|uniref:SH3 domain-containing protein n=1 Tax=Limnoglobus roseus TaxID=2598579 RepID=A0A5C1A9M2_9BACT|nr:hypothetical protein [Limnoglobus roseus]QEL16069.1 SH3 domain-containing protein [Limnoglobus roseus]